MKGRFLHRALLALMTGAVAAMAYCATHPPLWGGMVASAFVVVGLLVVLWHRGSVTKNEVLGLAILFRLFFLPLSPGLSDDTYRYVWDGQLQAEGVSPYAYRPSDPELASFQGSPLYEKLNSRDYYAVYPPVSELVFWAGAEVGKGEWKVSYYAIKGLFALMEVGGLFLLASMVPAGALMLYAWQPLVLLETAGQGHSEAALIFFLIASVWAFRKDRAFWAGAALAGAGWVKLYPFLLVPLLVRRMGWRAAAGTVVAAGLLAAPYASLRVAQHMAESLRLYVQLFEFNAGLYLGIKQLLWEVTGADWSKTLGPLLQVLFLLLLPLLYHTDARRSWSYAGGAIVIMGTFFVLSTTVHPWYILGVMALIPLSRPPAWHWHALSLGSIGTYLFYVGGPYWTFVALGWGGAFLLAAWRYGDGLLQEVLRRRAHRKAERVRPFLPSRRPLRVLDLGAGEGYVGAVLAGEKGVHVELADVLAHNRTTLPFRHYDGRELPFEANRFDATCLVFVLHHAGDPEQVVREALRVTEGRLIVLESVCSGRWACRLLRLLDRIANWLRSGGEMHRQPIRLRSAAAWRQLFEQAGASVKEHRQMGPRWHRQALFVIESPAHGPST